MVHEDFYHVAAYEAKEFIDIPCGLIAKILPPSRYAVYSCEASKDVDAGKQLESLQWENLFEKVLGENGVW